MEVNSSFGSIDIAVSGLRAQEKNIKTISSNVANAQTTDTGDGQPYRRIEAVFKAQGNDIGGVDFDEVSMDMSDFEQILKPGHPNADAQGYVAMPNVSVPIEMMNLRIAARSYEANTAVMKRYQQMVRTTLELLK